MVKIFGENILVRKIDDLENFSVKYFLGSDISCLINGKILLDIIE